MADGVVIDFGAPEEDQWRDRRTIHQSSVEYVTCNAFQGLLEICFHDRILFQVDVPSAGK